MDFSGFKLEQALKKLIETREPDRVYGFATAFEELLGDAKCAELSELLEQLYHTKLSPKNPED